MTAQRSRLVYATLFAMVFMMATALMVLAAFLVAELYLANKGLLGALPPMQELAHVRMRNLLLIFGLPVMGAAGFATGWFNHVPPDAAVPSASPVPPDPPDRART